MPMLEVTRVMVRLYGESEIPVSKPGIAKELSSFMSKIRVGVIFGGRSGEHEVSVQSARSIMSSLDPERYEIVPIGIDKGGRWHVGDAVKQTLATGSSFVLIEDEGKQEQAFLLDSPSKDDAVVPRDAVRGVDVFVPALHGSYGEDGTIQGMLEMLDVPYVGAGVLASAVGMDKTFMKRLFSVAGLPQVRYTFFTQRRYELEAHTIKEEIARTFGYPCFVKPANMGSSVGISKVKDETKLDGAIQLALRYDNKVIVEEGLDVREIEVGVLGNDEPKASIAGEIVPSNEFYDYRAKYMDGESALIIPAPLSDATMEEIRRMAVAAYEAVDCSGLARVDFFIEKNTDRVILNEINTMPGFTRFSMYPKLWEASGVSYPELIDRLIHLALSRHEAKRRIITEFNPD